MGLGKIIENGLALLRANFVLAFKKICSGSRLKYTFKSRFFARAEIVLRAKGQLELGKNLRLGKNSVLTAQGGKLIIGKECGINRDCIINSHESITIGDDTVIAPRVCIYDHDHVFDSENGVRKKEFKSAPVVIGKNVWIGAGTVILRGTTIGDNCVVGAGCVIKGTYPSGSVIVQKRETEIRGGGK